MENLSLPELCEGNLEAQKKALEMGISFYRSPVGEPGLGSSTRDFERWMKGALEVQRLYLKRLSGEGPKGGSFTGDP